MNKPPLTLSKGPSTDGEGEAQSPSPLPLNPTIEAVGVDGVKHVATLSGIERALLSQSADDIRIVEDWNEYKPTDAGIPEAITSIKSVSIRGDRHEIVYLLISREGYLSHPLRDDIRPVSKAIPEFANLPQRYFDETGIARYSGDSIICWAVKKTIESKRERERRKVYGQLETISKGRQARKENEQADNVQLDESFSSERYIG